jgi:hypothetical protein
MTLVAILLALLINLFFTAFLIAGLYYLSILPLYKQLESNARKLSHNSPPQMQVPFSSASRPEGSLPNMDDIPLDAFWGEGEEEDYRTTPEDVEEALTSRTHNTYNPSRKDPFQQLKGLNPDAQA